MKKRFLVDLICPTYDNPSILNQMLQSLWLSLGGPGTSLCRIIIVNNGRPESLQGIKASENLVLIQPKTNLGWERGLQEGLKVSDAPFVFFANDDIRFLPGDWFWKLMSVFNDPKVGAVGPSSNFVMGTQNIFADIPFPHLKVKFLIGFFMALRRKALDEAGGVDDTLPGGDDIDLSIRLRDKGYDLICRRDVFVFHHGSVTGQTVHPGYWNSTQMQEATNNALIRKHGMKKFWETMVVGWQDFQPYGTADYKSEDIEGKLCAENVQGESILELGCGSQKTVPNAIGVDLIAHGRHLSAHNLRDGSKMELSVADLVADVSMSLPLTKASQDTIIARHIIEHCQDPLGTLSVWNYALKIGGRLIIATPHNGHGNSILLNPEHVNSFTPSSLKNLAVISGFKVLDIYAEINGVSFVAILEKVEESNPKIISPRKTILPLGARINQLEEVAA